MNSLLLTAYRFRRRKYWRFLCCEKVWNLSLKIKHWKKSFGKVRVIRFTTGKKCCAFSSRWFDTQGRDPRTNQFIVISSGEPCFKDRNIQLLDLTNYFLFFHHLQAGFNLTSIQRWPQMTFKWPQMNLNDPY